MQQFYNYSHRSLVRELLLELSEYSTSVARLSNEVNLNSFSSGTQNRFNWPSWELFLQLKIIHKYKSLFKLDENTEKKYEYLEKDLVFMWDTYAEDIEGNRASYKDFKTAGESARWLLKQAKRKQK